jgi:hypothetical protein
MDPNMSALPAFSRLRISSLHPTLAISTCRPSNSTGMIFGLSKKFRFDYYALCRSSFEIVRREVNAATPFALLSSEQPWFKFEQPQRNGRGNRQTPRELSTGAARGLCAAPSDMLLDRIAVGALKIGLSRRWLYSSLSSEYPVRFAALSERFHPDRRGAHMKRLRSTIACRAHAL